MIIFLSIIHILVCFFLIFIVLIQGGKGAELGAAFGGGSSQTLFGSRGAATFLNKLTTVVAVVFMITSLVLAVGSMKGGSDVTGGVTSGGPAVPAPGSAPGAAPGAPAGPEGSFAPPAAGGGAAAPSPVPPAEQGASK